jgi:hypothetical protein
MNLYLSAYGKDFTIYLLYWLQLMFKICQKCPGFCIQWNAKGLALKVLIHCILLVAVLMTVSQTSLLTAH